MIFCVEDDENIRKLIVYTLESTGFEAKGFEEGQSFLNALETEIPDLIILDIMLPGMDGMEILSKLKQSEKMKDIPVVMATAKGAEYDKVKGLDAGADDYITKPFGMLELVARAHIRNDTCIYMDYGSEEMFNHAANGEALISMSHLLLTKRVNLALRVVPGGTHSESSWEKQIPIFMECLGL
jgi:DNA-binding response OmpR family regulator